MTGLPTDAARSALMKRVRRSGTSGERAVAKACRDLGLSYRLNVRSLPGSPDLANTSRRWAIFVNGCYWHHHTGCLRATIPARNRDFWTTKFAANRRRDAHKIRALRARGFRVVVVWECQTLDVEVLAGRLSRLRAPRLGRRCTTPLTPMPWSA